MITVKSQICLAVLSRIVLSINAERSSESGFRETLSQIDLHAAPQAGL